MILLALATNAWAVLVPPPEGSSSEKLYKGAEVNIRSVRVDPASPQTGSRFWVSTGIKNDGDFPAEGFVRIEIRQNGRVVHRSSDIGANIYTKSGVSYIELNNSFVLDAPGDYVAHVTWESAYHRAGLQETKEVSFRCGGPDVSKVPQNPMASGEQLRAQAEQKQTESPRPDAQRMERMRREQAEQARQQELKRQEQQAARDNQEQMRREQAERDRQERIRQEQRSQQQAEIARRQQESASRQHQEEMQRQQVQQQRADQDRQNQLARQSAALGFVGMMMRDAEERAAREKAESEQAQREEARTTLTWSLRSYHPNIVHVQFYSLDRDALWPANDRVYTLNDSEVHEMTIRGQPGERVCYGAWVAGNPSISWGTGKDRAHNPDPNNIHRIGGGSTSIISLIPPPMPESSTKPTEHATSSQQETGVELRRQGGIINVRLGSEERQRKHLRSLLPVEAELPTGLSYRLPKRKEFEDVQGVSELLGGNPGVTEDRELLEKFSSEDNPFWDKDARISSADIEAFAAGVCGSDDGAITFFALALKTSGLGTRLSKGLLRGSIASDFKKATGDSMHVLNAQRFVVMIGFTDRIREGAYKEFVQIIMSRLQKDEVRSQGLRVIREGPIVQPRETVR